MAPSPNADAAAPFGGLDEATLTASLVATAAGAVDDEGRVLVVCARTDPTLFVGIVFSVMSTSCPEKSGFVAYWAPHDRQSALAKQPIRTTRGFSYLENAGA